MHTYYGIDIPDTLKIQKYTFQIDPSGMVSTDDWEQLRHIEECLEIGWRLHQIIQRSESIDSTLG